MSVLPTTDPFLYKSNDPKFLKSSEEETSLPVCGLKIKCGVTSGWCSLYKLNICEAVGILTIGSQHASNDVYSGLSSLCGFILNSTVLVEAERAFVKEEDQFVFAKYPPIDISFITHD